MWPPRSTSWRRWRPTARSRRTRASTAGPVIERDLDIFGQTVNLASRIADAAGPGEVFASEAVMDEAGAATFSFERTGEVHLKGLPEPIPLFRVHRRRQDA